MEGNSTAKEWKKTADTTHMGHEDIRAAGVPGSQRPPGQNPGGVLHQRRNLPFSKTTMAMAGLVITGAAAYFTLYVKKKPEADAIDVAKVTTGMATPENTRPRQ